MRRDNVASQELPGLRDLHIVPTALEGVVSGVVDTDGETCRWQGGPDGAAAFYWSGQVQRWIRETTLTAWYCNGSRDTSCGVDAQTCGG